MSGLRVRDVCLDHALGSRAGAAHASAGGAIERAGRRGPRAAAHGEESIHGAPAVEAWSAWTHRRRTDRMVRPSESIARFRGLLKLLNRDLRSRFAACRAVTNV